MEVTGRERLERPRKRWRGRVESRVEMWDGQRSRGLEIKTCSSDPLRENLVKIMIMMIIIIMIIIIIMMMMSMMIVIIIIIMEASADCSLFQECDVESLRLLLLLLLRNRLFP